MPISPPSKCRSRMCDQFHSGPAYQLLYLSDMPNRPYLPLTLREREIISLLAEGVTSKEIALKLDLSHRTVEVYRANLLKKFGASNTGGLLSALSGIDSEMPD